MPKRNLVYQFTTQNVIQYFQEKRKVFLTLFYMSFMYSYKLFKTVFTYDYIILEYLYCLISEANVNFLFSTFTITMSGGNKHLDNLRILTTTEQCSSSEIYSQHPTLSHCLVNTQSLLKV